MSRKGEDQIKLKSGVLHYIGEEGTSVARIGRLIIHKTQVKKIEKAKKQEPSEYNILIGDQCKT